MTEQRADTPSTTRPPDDPHRDKSNTLMNALIGAVVTVITAPLLPFAAIFGGAAAGYLQSSDLGEGAKIGAISGAVAALPAILLAWLVVSLVFIGADPFFGLSILLAIVVVGVVVGYLVGAGALGGALGAYLRSEL